jgi:hypothetical protein
MNNPKTTASTVTTVRIIRLRGTETEGVLLTE